MLCDCIKQHPTIEKISISFSDIFLFAGLIIALAELIEGSSVIKEINLSRGFFHNNEITPFANAIRKNRSLRKLDFSDVKFLYHYQSAKIVAEAIVAVWHEQKRTIRVDGIYKFDALLEEAEREYQLNAGSEVMRAQSLGA